MNKSFVLFDKNTNVQKQANTIVGFVYEEKEYLIYSVDENEVNRQIFVSRIITNSEGKNFIENINLEEKNKLSNLVYNIVILLPSEFNKGGEAHKLIEDFSNRLGIKIFNNIPDFNQQEYYASCSIAITSKDLVELSIKFYKEYLVSDTGINSEIPVCTIPDNLNSISQPQQDTNVVRDNLVTLTNPNNNINGTTIYDTSEIHNKMANSSDFSLPNQNPQAEKLAVVKDQNLANAIGIDARGIQPNMVRNNSAGFAQNKYIIIGTICLILAVAVVIAAIILIKNK